MSESRKSSVKKAQAKPVQEYTGGGVQTDDGRTLFGFDAEVYLRMKSKEDPDWERTVGMWINQVIAPDQIADIGDLYVSLKDGLVLCQMMNKLRPGTIPKWSDKSKAKNGVLHPLMERENITLYLEACWKVGVNSDDMFIVADLHSKKGIQAVLTNIAAISNMAPSWGYPLPGVGITNRPTALDMENKKKDGFKWQVHTGTGPVYSQEAIDGDEVEVLENEVQNLRQQLEESQRTISKLDGSKNYLTEQLKMERRKIIDSDKEVNYLKSAGKSGNPGPYQTQFIDDLKKSRDELHKELSALKREIGSGLNLAALRKELEETRAQKKILEEKLVAIGDGVGIEKLQARLKTLTAENIGFMSQAVAGTGMDVSSFLKRMQDLEEEKTTLATEYEKKMHVLTVKIAAVEDECFKEMCAFEEEKESEFDQQNSLRAQAEEALRNLKASNAEEILKLHSEIEDLKIEKGVISHEYNIQKSLLETQINNLKSEIKSKTEEIAKEHAKVKKHKETLVREQQARKVELENALQAIKKKHDEQLAEYKYQVEKLAKEKTAASEKSFQETRKLTQELFQKQTELQIAQKKSSGVAGDEPTENEESGLVELERAHMASDQAYEREKLLRDKEAAVDAVGRALLDERRKADSLALELEKIKERMQSRITAESERLEKELEELLGEIENLESQLQESKQSSVVPLKELQDKLSALTAQSVKEKIQLENKIRELDQQKVGVEAERESLQKRLTSEMAALTTRLATETQKYKTQLEQMEKTAKLLLEEQEITKAANLKSASELKFLEEMASMRSVMDTALQILNGQKPGVTLDSLTVPTELELKHKKLEALLAEKTKENTTQKTLMAHQHKMWDAAEEQLKKLRAQGITTTPITPTPAKPTPAPTAPALTPEAIAAKKALQEKHARANNRKSTLLYLEKNTVEADMQKLTETIENLMLGEPVAKDSHTAFKGLFKLDNGRRLLCFSLHETSAGSDEPFLMPLASFEILKWMLTDVMNNLNLSDGSDTISGRLLLECSLLIGRESKKGKEPELLQAHIKPHRVWINTYFWEEYFWTQVTPKFDNLNIENKQDECAFFKVEIAEFAKSMLGWGNLDFYKIALFVESLCEKCDLSETVRVALVKEVEAYCSGASQKSEQKAVTVVSSHAQRRTVAFSHNQIQDALKNEGEDKSWPIRAGAPARPAGSPASRGSSRQPKASSSKNPPPPGAAPPAPGAKKDDSFQLSRRKQAAKTVSLTSTGFLANLSMSNSNTNAYI